MVIKTEENPQKPFDDFYGHVEGDRDEKGEEQEGREEDE